MTTSRHRLTLNERREPVEIYPLSELQDRYIANHESLGRSHNTIYHYRDTFRLFGVFLSEQKREATSAALTTEVTREFATWIRNRPTERVRRGSTTRSEFGIHGVLKDMRAFIKWLTEEEFIKTAVKVPVPKLPQNLFPVLTDQELERVWQSKYLVGKSSLAIRNRAMLGLMLDTGIRRAEVAGLTLDALDLDFPLITVTGKGKKQRRVPFSTAVRDLLIEWLRIRGDEEGSLFWLAPAGIRMVFRRIRDDVGLDLLHPHLFRHQAATMLVRNNADVESVRRMLGHADISTTLRYLSMSDEDLRIKQAAASPYDSMVRKSAIAEATPKRKRLSLKAS